MGGQLNALSPEFPGAVGSPNSSPLGGGGRQGRRGLRCVSERASRIAILERGGRRESAEHAEKKTSAISAFRDFGQ